MTTHSPTRTTLQRTDLALTMLRVTIGLIFIAHGYQKLAIYTLPGTTGAFTQMGVPLPALMAPLIALSELIGGAALAAGLFTRVAAALLATDMVGALILVHLKAGFFNPDGAEFPLALLAASLTLALTGAGAYALDARRPSRARN
ncbi:DoxX family protein [Deinococcus radiotolerans]|uniref:LysR family transcriptional regulator n=1 Tax=Deinococcus radiotolerans TaxID=1309407 RepID=A0ABQ2FM85_9DEIO|nr:DoxX family protein [Deinococcus radiotolerans]GGL08538.1 LysR family transcriptional regulator [Deinococcus radiotolerans]